MNIRQLPSQFVICTINTIRPFLGPAECKFSISCTRYAELQFNEQRFFVACWNITKRVLSCNPFF